VGVPGLSLAATPYVLPPLLASATSVGLALYAWLQRRTAPGASGFAGLMAAAGWWALSNALQIGGTDLWTKVLWHRAQYVGILLVPLAWLAFTIQYTRHEGWLRPRSFAAAGIVPALMLVLILTNERHHLVWTFVGLRSGGPFLVLETARGPCFWISTAFAYLCLVLGVALLLPRLLGSPRLQRRQTATLLLGLAIPWLSNALFLTQTGRVGHDLTPFTLAISGVICAWGLFRYRLLDLVPVARDAVIEGMSDGMVVFDDAGRIVDLNPAARRILGEGMGDPLGRTAAEAFGGWPELVEALGRADPADVALGEGGARRSYELRLSPLTDRRGRSSGRLLVLRDATVHKRTEAELAAEKRLFENLLAVARATTERPTLAATLQNTLQVASTLTGAQGSSLILIDERGATTDSIIVENGMLLLSRPDFAGQVLERGLAGWVMRNREPALVADAQSDERWLPIPRSASFEVRSALSFPIGIGPSLVGVLTLVHAQPDYFSLEQLGFIRAAAAQIAVAVHNAQTFDAYSRLAERQTRLYEVLRAVGGELDPAAVPRVAVEAIGQRTTWLNVTVSVPAEGGRSWRIEALKPELSNVGQQPLEAGIVGRAFVTGRTQNVADVAADPDYVIGSPLIRSELAVPLRRGSHRLGVLNLESDRRAEFGPEDVQFAESLADAVALSLDNARQHRQLLDLEKMRDELTHTLVHDLRNPLTSVSGVLEVLESGLTRGAAPEIQQELLRVAHHSARRMADMIDDILDVSRLESGHMPVELARVSLAPLVDETFQLEQPLAREKKLLLESRVPPEPLVEVDPRLLGRVLQNLVGNAVKFTPHGGRVSVSAELAIADPPMVRVVVSDNGPGISPQVRERLFQKFVTAGVGHGTGLGLAFCRLAVEAQGGKIWMEDRGGRGCTFCFTVPVSCQDTTV